MMTIEEEINHVFVFLSHSGGFNIDMAGLLCIPPINEACPPTVWEVEWLDTNCPKHPRDAYNCYFDFNDLKSAVEFFVKKRHEMEWGLDFEHELYVKGF